ncbi:MAG: hypothetical protein ACP5RN_00015 [Armatimonadota bacterium]
MTATTWWALAFIAACVVFIVWVRVKYPLPDPTRARRRASPRRQRPTKGSSKARTR